MQTPKKHTNASGQTLVDDPFGYEAFAATHCIAPHTAVALAASLLSGIAGPSLYTPGGGRSGLSLARAANDTCLATAISALTANSIRPHDLLCLPK